MRKATILTGAALLVGLAGAVSNGSATAFHFALSRSAPAADATVPSPAEIRLWFTQEPQENSISIRLLDGHGEMVETAEVTGDADEPTVFSIGLDHSLGAGPYTVAWRGIGPDGHAVRGDFAFTVTAY